MHIMKLKSITLRPIVFSEIMMSRISFIVIVAVFAVIGAINILNAKADDLQTAQQQLGAACQQEKDAMLDPNLPTDSYNNELQYYNDHCGSITGVLQPK